MCSLLQKDVYIISLLLMDSNTPDTLNKAQLWDLYKLDRDLRQSVGAGIFPPVFSNILERYFAIGEIDMDKANEALSELMRAKPDELKVISQ